MNKMNLTGYKMYATVSVINGFWKNKMPYFSSYIVSFLQQQKLNIQIIQIFLFPANIETLQYFSYSTSSSGTPWNPLFWTQIVGLLAHRCSCCTAVSSMVRLDCCHVMLEKRKMKRRAVTSSHSEHAPKWNLFSLPERLLCAVAKLDFQIKKPVGDQDSSFSPSL